MKIITGKTATEHVNSEDDRGLYAGIFGSGSYILNIGTKFQTSIESSTTIRINSGDLVHQGCHARIPYDEYDEVTIDAGTTGYKRIDLIVARYEKNAGLESMSLVAIKGQPAVSDPVAPDYNNGNILEGANISDMPLYKVVIDGVNIESVSNMATLYTIGSYIYPVGSIYISVNDVNPATLFGGTWERIQGKFLLSSSDSHELGSTGGSETKTFDTNNHTLTVDEMPSHTHKVVGDASSPGNTIAVSPEDTQGAATGSLPSVNTIGTTTGLEVDGVAQATGGGQGHNHSISNQDIMPPYLTVNMWKRIA